MRTLGFRPKKKQKEQVAETREHFFDLCDILQKIIPPKYDYVIQLARNELLRLCEHYD